MRKNVWLAAILLGMTIWAVVLSLLFTGHTKLLWTAQKGIKVVGKAANHARRAEHRALGDREAPD